MAEVFDIVGAGILVLGFLWSAGIALRHWRTAGGTSAYRRLRTTFGGVLLLALEIFVAADLIRTVAVAPSMSNVLVLAVIVAIRTFLSFSLQIEMEGVLPWRRGSSAAGRPQRSGA